MWDVVFAVDPTLELVDYVCVAMLLRIRWQLLDADSNGAVTLLLRYPEPSAASGPVSFVRDALHLRDHLDFEGGNHVISTYSRRASRPGRATPRPLTAQKPLDAARHTFPRVKSPAQLIQESGGLEALLQDAAKGVYTRGEKWGVNKALRDAVSEVKKNVQDWQTPRLPPKHGQPADLIAKIEALEQRNRSLARTLEDAVTDLWEQQRVVAKKETEETTARSMTMAIAKVQLVQVYLDNSSVPLPQDESLAKPDSQAPKQTAEPSGPPVRTRSPRTSNLSSEASTTGAEAPPQASSKSAAPTSSRRPTLGQSTFSWMLGQQKDYDAPPPSRSFVSASPFVPQTPGKTPNRLNSGFLFGDDDDDPDPVVRRRGGGGGGGEVENGEDGTSRKIKKKGKGKREVRKDEEERRESYSLAPLE